MKQAKIAEIKNHLSRFLEEVQRGETIRILDRNKPVAELVPYHPAKDEVPPGLAELERAGHLRRGPAFGKRPAESWFRAPRPKAELLKALLEDRDKDR